MHSPLGHRNPPQSRVSAFFFFNDTATTEIYTLSLHDALPIFPRRRGALPRVGAPRRRRRAIGAGGRRRGRPLCGTPPRRRGSGEDTAELQSLAYFGCRLLL